LEQRTRDLVSGAKYIARVSASVRIVALDRHLDRLAREVLR